MAYVSFWGELRARRWSIRCAGTTQVCMRSAGWQRCLAINLGRIRPGGDEARRRAPNHRLAHGQAVRIVLAGRSPGFWAFRLSGAVHGMRGTSHCHYNAARHIRRRAFTGGRRRDRHRKCQCEDGDERGGATNHWLLDVRCGCGWAAACLPFMKRGSLSFSRRRIAPILQGDPLQPRPGEPRFVDAPKPEVQVANGQNSRRQLRTTQPARRCREDQWIAEIFHPCAVRTRTISSAPVELIVRPFISPCVVLVPVDHATSPRMRTCTGPR